MDKGRDCFVRLTDGLVEWMDERTDWMDEWMVWVGLGNCRLDCVGSVEEWVVVVDGWIAWMNRWMDI